MHACRYHHQMLLPTLNTMTAACSEAMVRHACIWAGLPLAQVRTYNCRACARRQYTTALLAYVQHAI